MMSSFIIGTQTKGHRHFKGELPSIFQIQEDIETAWDRGINAEGRVETGGIRGTRKYIGTPEVNQPRTGLLSFTPANATLVRHWPCSVC